MKVKLSNYFIPFRKETSATNATAKMIKGGFIQQQSSGIFTWLNLGLRMLDKLTLIIDEEMQKNGATKILMPMVQDAKLWKDSNRLDGYGSEILSMKDRNNHEFLFGPSAEELITTVVQKWPLNKNSFPLILYNTQWKFRDEIRPRFATVRSREFLMKDAYSFHKDKDCLMITYEKMFNAYSNIFSKIGMNVCTFESDPGVMGGFLTHEFMVKSEFGETYLDYDKWPNQPIEFSQKDNVTEASSGESKFAEIAQIYALGNHYTKTFKLYNPENNEPLLMGCYGIGVSRIISLFFEREHDLGILAPFAITLVTLHTDDENCMEISKKIYNHFPEVIWDDCKNSAGKKFAQADLLGSPMQIFVGKNEASENKITIKINSLKQTILLKELLY